VGLVLTSLCWGRAGIAQDAVRPAPPETGFFSVQVGTLPPRTLTVVVDGRDVLLPFASLMEATGTPYGVGAGDSFRSESTEGIAADTALHQLVAETLTVQLAPSEMRIIDGDVYVPAAHIADLLHATADVDWSKLAIHLDREQAFPAEVAADTERRRATLVPAVPPAGDLVPFRPRWGGLVLDWEFSASGLNPTRNATIAPTISTAAWGGELRAGAIAGTDADGDATPVRPVLSFNRVFPTGRVVRQLDVGDVLTDGVVAEQLTGFRITNTPFRQADVFGLVPIRADVPAGWEYEVYQDGRLVGFSDAISDGAPPAAVRYGTTGVRIREIAPDGSARVRDLTFSVPFSMAPKGNLRYDLGAGSCRWRACDWGGFASARYGLTHGLTIGGGANYRRAAEGGGTLVPHASMALATSRGVSAELQVERGGAGHLHAQLSGAGRLSLSAGGRIDRALDAVGGQGAGTRFWSSDASATYRIGRAGLATARLSARVDGQVDAGVQRWSTGAALYHSAGTVELGYSAGAGAVVPRWDVRSTYLLPRFRGSLPASLTAGTSLGAGGVERVDAGLSLGIARIGSITASGGWERGARTPLLEVSFSASRGSFRMHGRTSSDTARAPHRMLLSGAGSVAWVGQAGLRTSPVRSGGAAGVTGRVYLDRDGDGVFTGADSAVAGQEVHVGGLAVVSDTHGYYAAWGLAPYGVAAVRLPPGAVSNPNLTPSASEHRLRPNPSRPETVNFPLITTRAVGGQVVGMAGADEPLGGLRVVLRDSSGAVTETTTFEDGAWYVPRLRPGSYVVSVAESSLRAVEAVSDTANLHVPAIGDDEIAAPQLALRSSVPAPIAHSDRNEASEPPQVRGDASAAAPVPAAAMNHGLQNTTADEERNAYAQVDRGRAAPGREQRLRQPAEAARGGGRTDSRADGDGALAPVRRGVLEGAGARSDDGVEHRAAVLPDRAPAEAEGAPDVPAGAGDGGGAGEGGEPEDDEQPAEPEELIYLVEERRTLRLRRGIARFVGK
jgi:hypothetical protein